MDIESYIAALSGEDIRSFSGASPPGKEIGRIEKPTDTYIYYEAEDENGNKQVYYTTESGLAFARKMQEAIWRHKKKELTY